MLLDNGGMHAIDGLSIASVVGVDVFEHEWQQFENVWIVFEKLLQMVLELLVAELLALMTSDYVDVALVDFGRRLVFDLNVELLNPVGLVLRRLHSIISWSVCGNLRWCVGRTCRARARKSSSQSAACP